MKSLQVALLCSLPWVAVVWAQEPRTDITKWQDGKLAHGVEGVGYEPVPAETLRAYFDDIKAREARLWVATFADAGKYARARMASQVTTRRAGDAIEVIVAHSLDPKLYDLQLTARTTVPAEWSSVRVTQGDVTKTLPVQRERGNSSVMYRITPNGPAARLQRAK